MIKLNHLIIMLVAFNVACGSSGSSNSGKQISMVGTGSKPNNVATPSLELNGVWVGHMKIRGLGSDRNRWYDCQADSKLEYGPYPYTHEFSVEVNLEGNKVQYNENLYCPVKIESKADEIGTIHPDTGVEISATSSDNQFMDIVAGKLVIKQAGNEFHVGYTTKTSIEVSFEGYFEEKITLSEDGNAIEFRAKRKSSETNEVLEVYAIAYRLEVVKDKSGDFRPNL